MVNPPTPTINLVEPHNQKEVLIQIQGSNKLHYALLDSGAGHSCIHKKIIDELQLTVEQPNGGVYIVRMADPQHTTARLGTTELIFKVHYMNDNRMPLILKKTFEIMNSSFDFIIGRDMLPILFPNNPLNEFLLPVSILGTLPNRLHMDFDMDDQGNLIIDEQSVNNMNIENVNTRETRTVLTSVLNSINYTDSKEEIDEQLWNITITPSPSLTLTQSNLTELKSSKSSSSSSSTNSTSSSKSTQQ